MTQRPMPPEELIDELRHPERFVPAPEVWSWIEATFLNRSSPLHNPEHGHLEAAIVGVVWTNVSNVRHMRQIVGMAEVPRPTQGGKWQKARLEFQLREWFGDFDLDFLITLDAPYCASVDNASFCALVEHEMYHCAQKRNQWGAPKFRRDGRPEFGIRGHDVEEFNGIVRRYGPQAAGRAVLDMVAAADRGPEIAPAQIAGACGSCRVTS